MMNRTSIAVLLGLEHLIWHDKGIIFVPWDKFVW